MQYSSAQINRVFVATFSDGEDILDGLKDLFIKENIESALFFIIGAIKEGKIVSGPKEDVIPPEPYWRSIDEAHEVVGIGNIFKSETEPKIHLHTTFAKKEMLKMGCLRSDAKTFLLLEVILFEIKGANLFKGIDEKTGLLMLKGFSKSL